MVSVVKRCNRNRKKTKPSDPYNYDYDALTTTLTSRIFLILTGF